MHLNILIQMWNFMLAKPGSARRAVAGVSSGIGGGADPRPLALAASALSAASNALAAASLAALSSASALSAASCFGSFFGALASASFFF